MEFDDLYYFGLLPYYVPDDEKMTKEEMENIKELDGTGVNRNYLNSLLKNVKK